MNPEFRRNLWLEAGPRRLAWAGVVLAAIFGATAVVGQNDPAKALTIAGMIVFLVAGLFWGPRTAGQAVAEEVIQRTWDFQRLSALTPWTMTWGKLFGATSLAWIAALAGLVVTTVAASLGRDTARLWQNDLSLLAGAILLQAGSMALSLVGVRRARAEGRAAGFRFTFGGVVGLFFVVGALARVLPTQGRAVSPILMGFGSQTWWGLVFADGWFVALSLVFFAAWSVVAAWRLMRLELQMENFPWAWPLFVLAAGAWAAGMNVGPAERFAIAGAVFALCAYAAAFAEPADRVRLRQFGQALADRALMRAAYLAPAAVAPVKLALLAVVGMALSPHSLFANEPTPMLGLAAFAFLVRDLGIIAYFRFGPRPRRGDFGAVVGLFLAYFIGGVVGSRVGGDAGGALFTPSFSQPAVSVAAGAVQAVLIWVLAWSRVRAPERSEV